MRKEIAHYTQIQAPANLCHLAYHIFCSIVESTLNFGKMAKIEPS